MDRRVVVSLAAGLAGLAVGMASVVLSSPLLGALAGACALLAAGASVALQHRLTAAETRAAASAALAKLVDVPAPVRQEPAALIDDVTALPNDRYFELAVEERVAAARRHLWPVTIALLEITVAPDLRDGGLNSSAVATFAGLIRKTLRESDVACRIGPRQFGLVLEDTGEDGGVWTVERLQIALAHDVSKVRRVAAGVATYPTHGLRADEVLLRARAALTRACAAEAGRGLGQVEVAQADFA